MAINVIVNKTKRIVPFREEGLTLVILKDAVAKENDDKGVPVRVTSLNQLHETYTASDVSGKVELYSAEYLLSIGVPLLVYAPIDGTFDLKNDGAVINDVEFYNYKQVIAPNQLISSSSTQDNLTGIVSTGGDNDLGLDVRLYLDVALNSGTVPLDLGSKYTHNLEYCFNGAMIDFPSLVVEDIKGSVGYSGVPASTILAGRKARLLEEKTPWIPVAGYENGVIPEATSVKVSVSTKLKEELQESGINVLLYRYGVGVVFVTQNTRAAGDGVFKRSNNATQALWLKDVVGRIAAKYEYKPNNSITWKHLKLDLVKLFDSMYDVGGIGEPANILVGDEVTTQEELREGILRALVEYKPTPLAEAIIINVNVIEEQGVSVELDAGGAE